MHRTAAIVTALAVGLTCVATAGESENTAAGPSAGSAMAASDEVSAGLEGGTEIGSLSYYLALAGELSPRIGAAEASASALAERARHAGGLPEPQLTYGHYFEEVETRVGPQIRRLGVRQKLPLFGRSGLARRAAEARASAESARSLAVELDTALAVTRAYADYHYIMRAAEIVQERVLLLASLESVVRESYAVGTASYADLMGAQIALGRAEDELASLRDRTGAASAGLAAVVGTGADTDLPLSGPLPTPELLSSAAARSMFELDNPDLAALGLELEAARREKRRASRGYLPDVTLGVDYIETNEAAGSVADSGKDPIIGMVTVNLPIWFGQTRAKIREADSRQTLAEERLRAAGNELSARLEMALADSRDLERRVELLNARLVPAARQSLSATEEAYSGGDADFDALVRAHEISLELELALERARADLLIKSAELARLTGSGRTRRHADADGAAGDDK